MGSVHLGGAIELFIYSTQCSTTGLTKFCGVYYPDSAYKRFLAANGREYPRKW